jgi:RNA polymerase sigma-70 factor (ECF subfamily)
VEPGPENHGHPTDRHASELLQTGELLARFQRGERNAADDLFRRYRPRLDAFLRARVPAGARKLGDTDDLVQEVCVKILGALGRFEMRGIGSFWWFARSIAQHHLIDAARRAKALHETKLPDASDVAPAAKLRGPMFEAADHESAAAFDRALERVPDHVRSGLLMRLELGLDWSVVAADCGFPSPDAARVAIKRALRAIAKEMAGHGEGS